MQHACCVSDLRRVSLGRRLFRYIPHIGIDSWGHDLKGANGLAGKQEEEGGTVCRPPLFLCQSEIKVLSGETDLDALVPVIVTDDAEGALFLLRGAAARSRRLQTGGGGVLVGHAVADTLLPQLVVEQDKVLIINVHCCHILSFHGDTGRVDMDHDVLDIREAVLHVGVDLFRDLVGLTEGFVAVHLDLQIDVDLVAEHSGAEQVHADHALFFGHIIPQGLLVVGAAGGVQQLGDSVLQNVVGDLEDEEADDHAGHRVQHREAQHGAGDADEGADGGQGVGAVVPGVGQEGAGVDELGVVAGVPVHGLLAHDGDHRRHQGDGAGDGDGLVAAGEDGLQAHFADAQPRDHQDGAQQQGGDALQALMAVRVGGVGRLFGDPDPDPGDEGGEYVGEGVDGVRDHGAGIAGNAGEKLEAGQDCVSGDADKGQLADDGFLIECGLLGGGAEL